MIVYPNKVDKADVAWLVAAMVKANEEEYGLPEGECARVDVPDIGVFIDIACDAMTLVQRMHRQDDANWDGVVWFERLNDEGEGSLADRLVSLAIGTSEEDPPHPDMLRRLVVKWLVDKGL